MEAMHFAPMRSCDAAGAYTQTEDPKSAAGSANRRTALD